MVVRSVQERRHCERKQLQPAEVLGSLGMRDTKSPHLVVSGLSYVCCVGVLERLQKSVISDIARLAGEGEQAAFLAINYMNPLTVRLFTSWPEAFRATDSL